MDYAMDRLICGLSKRILGLSLFLISSLLITLSTSKRCGYRLYARDPWTHDYSEHLPTEFGIKECTWGCCWNQKDDVCCPFPKEVAMVAFMSCLAVVLVVSITMIILWYLFSKRKNRLRNRSIARPGNLRIPVNCILSNSYSSDALHQGYSHLDSELPPPYSSSARPAT